MAVVNAIKMAHNFILPQLANANLVIDATAGNGNDTLFLAKNSSAKTAVWAFDIQPQAIANTRSLLKKHGLLDKARLILDNHANIVNYINHPVDIAMFNLGYLPGGDHSKNTCPATTLQALEQILQLITIGGLLTIAAYPGYEYGKMENDAVHQYLTTLPQQTFTVAAWTMVNQVNSPPVLYIIEKRRCE
jgi:predicted O-methyltransferase YrrM